MKTKILALLALSVSCALSWIISSLDPASFPLLAVPWIVYCVGVQRWRLAVAPHALLDDEISSFVTDPSAGIHHPVDIAIFHGSTLIGEDSGVLTTVDRWLMFHGLRCSFWLKSEDVESASFSQERTLFGAREFDEFPVCLLLNTHACERRLTIIPIRASRGVVQESLEAELSSWFEEPSASGISTFPPAEPHPITTYYRWLRFWSAFTFLPVALTLQLSTFPSPWESAQDAWAGLGFLAILCMTTAGVIRSAQYAAGVTASRRQFRRESVLSDGRFPPSPEPPTSSPFSADTSGTDV